MAELKLNIIKAHCAAKGIRMIEQRRVAARVLAGSADHPDVEELCRLVDHRLELCVVPLADDKANS